MAKTPLSGDELKTALSTQIGFLARSVDSFDAGFLDEAIRMAVTIRVMVHQTRNSHALLEQLGQLATLSFLDTGNSYDPRNLLPSHALIGLSFDQGYSPHLDFFPAKKRVSFSVWWNSVVLADPTSKMTMTRQDLVLTAANQDGGAHVDPALNTAYRALKAGPGWWTVETSDGKTFQLGSEHLYSLRQIAHEVLATVDPTYPLKVPAGAPISMAKRPPP